MRQACLLRECLAEFIGIFILVFFGVGAVHTAVACGAQQGLWQVAIVWGVAIGLAIYATGAVSGTHINPAVTLTFAVYREFPWRKVPAYLLAQLAGATAGAGVLYGLFCHVIHAFEVEKGIVRGAPGSQLSAMMYGEYFPNPGALGVDAAAFAKVTHFQAFLAEAIGTAFLLFFICSIVDARNPGRPIGTMGATFIGLTVSIVISIVAPLTQAGLNPARDFGPRLVSYFAGWGSIAIPGPRHGFFDVYILAPIIGGIVGAGVYKLLIAPGMPGEDGADACEA
jgi:glycerol uptake facilitator protein